MNIIHSFLFITPELGVTIAIFSCFYKQKCEKSTVYMQRKREREREKILNYISHMLPGLQCTCQNLSDILQLYQILNFLITYSIKYCVQLLFILQLLLLFDPWMQMCHRVNENEPKSFFARVLTVFSDQNRPLEPPPLLNSIDFMLFLF